MKKILFALTLAGLSILGFSTAGAQYYDYGNYYGNTYYDGSYMNSSMYSSYPSNYYYSYPQNYNYYGSSYGGGVGSYTIGCTTYYYNTRTGTQLYTQNICNTYNYTYSYPYTYTYPYNYTYPSTQYCTYGYINGVWYPCTSNSYLFGNSGYNYNNYRGCYYNQRGQYVCY